MTPQEKAKELVDKYRLILIHSETDAGEEILCTNISKQSALIAVDEILEEYKEDYEEYESKGLFTIYSWWKEVKQEIEKL